MAQSLWLQNFISVYSELSKDNLAALGQVYHPDIEFCDPLHRLNGLPSLVDYFEHLYQNLLSCDFKVDQVLESQQEAAVYWTMSFRHKQLNGGELITISGHSHLRAQDNKVIYHRDYLDAGAMLYEHVPVLGALVRLIKRRAVK
ncbi:nuclear transport factor 2 family protein [Shewanella sp. Isolate11]|uniref:nuclear transport factor 2 family protein n=1 Tax=Shewanella sp. Isolate11 TaxID=2908530 RepID=UPI001EFC32C7|nr:nuclear transport factor 2 family protein [Shewanella sp. Isolate11]MCG9697083.1 nuclear transport factor 2 family protein [Shewanella sp. Isolate11]